MEIVKSLWQQLQESKSEYKQLNIEEIEKALAQIYSDRKKPVNWIPAYLVLNMNDEEFRFFMKTKHDYKVTCNAEQLKLLEKRIK